MNETPPKILSPASFAAAIRWAFNHAIAHDARRIVCVDPHFDDWPLDDAALRAQLAHWLRQPKRRLVLLASSFDSVPLRHARFAAWRAEWSHAIDAYSPPEDRVELPTVLVDDRDLSVELIDVVHWRGRVDVDAAVAHRWRERVDVLLQRSEPSFPVNRLGL